MKKALSRIVSLLLVLCLVTALVPAVFAADENEVQILFLDTSDVHGQQFATDYTQDASLSGTHYQGMTPSPPMSRSSVRNTRTYSSATPATPSRARR